jgi:LPXTG-motif cell wall-anchored protein
MIRRPPRKTPKTDNTDAPLLPPAIDPTSVGDFFNNADSNIIYDKDGNILKLDPKGGGVLDTSSGKNNTMLYVGGAALLAAGIYFATKKK